MTGKLPAGKVTVSVGSPQNLAKSANQVYRIAEFADLFSQPYVTPEKFRDYKSASFKRKQQLKSSGGWWIRCPIDGGIRNRKSVKPATIISYDLDNVPAELVDSLLKGEVLEGIGYIVHSTRSHTPEEPRLRLILFVSEAIPPEDYGRASRIVGVLIDPKLEHIDPVSFRPAQMMFMPSVSKDMLKHYIFHIQGGAKLDWRAEIEAWEEANGDSLDFRNLPKAASEAALRETAEEAEDPLTKKGPVGDFCRAWTITELVTGKETEDGEHIEGPLADIYHIDDWENGCASRMTYTKGHSTNGAVVYGDLFCYSHHGTDPASDMLCNAYDLVRLHKFAEQDNRIDDDTPMKDRPSVKAMKEWMSSDPFYRQAQVESRYGAMSMLGDEDADTGFDLDDLDEDEAADEGDSDDDDISADDLLGVKWSDIKSADQSVMDRRRRFAKKPKKGWLRDLNFTDAGVLKITLPNSTQLVTNDPRLFRKIAYNQLRNEVVALGDIDPKNPTFMPLECRDKVYGDRWTDMHSNLIGGILELESGKKGGGYDTRFPINILEAAIVEAGRHNAFHPVKDFIDMTIIDNVPVDVELLETFLIRHLGAPSKGRLGQYSRDVAKMIAIASVERIENPGCKFDYAPILEGPQGIGKSTFIKALYGAAFFGELTSDIRDERKAAESLMGKWAVELPELSTLHKSESNDMKAFMTKLNDDVRLAYGRHVAFLPRQNVFWGTTNDEKYFRDASGNRRYWPVPCDGRYIDPVAVMSEMRIFWRTAKFLQMQMREEQPYGDLDLSLKGESKKVAEELQAERRKQEPHDEWAAMTLDWLEEPVKVEVVLAELGREYDALGDSINGVAPETMVQRVAFTKDMVLTQVLDRHSPVSNSQTDSNMWAAAEVILEKAGWVRRGKFGVGPSNGTPTFRVGGKMGRWRFRDDVTREEIAMGFRVMKEPPGDREDDEGLI